MKHNLKFTTKARFRLAPCCPCGKSNRDGKFAPYEDNPECGFCHSCGENFLPQQKKYQKFEFTKPIQMEQKFVDEKLFWKTQKYYDKNVFACWLMSVFGEENMRIVLDLYRFGTTQDGSVIFWQINKDYKVCTGQKISYCSDGHRDKSKMPKRLFTRADGYQPCFFGEHLLSEFPEKVVAIVESEKTALICFLFFPEMIWLASSGMNGLTKEKCKVLEDRHVILFPDIHDEARTVWTRKKEDLEVICDVKVCDISPNENNKLDIADYLLSTLKKSEE